MEETLGSWLRKKLEEERLSLREAAEKTKVNHQTINNIIKGSHTSAETVLKIACGFGGKGNEGKVLTDKLLVLAGYRIQGMEISLPIAKLLDIINDFSKAKIEVVISFARYMTEQ